MKKAVGYLRVSGEIQVKGSGYDRQEQSIKLYAKKNKIQIDKWYKEAHTGTEADRPVFHEMVEDLLSNSVRLIIVESMDRFARDAMVQGNLIAHLILTKIDLISAASNQNVTEEQEKNPWIKMLVQVQGSFAELEKSLLVRRLKAGRERARKAGRKEGVKPFGSRDGEKDVLKRMRQLYRKPRNGKRRSYYRIAKLLNQEGLPTRTGKQWQGPTVKGILQRTTA